MKTVLIASLAVAFSAAAGAQTMIYKLIDDSGRVTYSNKPMKGATVMELDPITVIPTPPVVVAAKLAMPAPAVPAAPAEKTASADKSAMAIVTPLGPSLAAIDMQTQKRRDDGRRRILEDELSREEQALEEARGAVAKEQTNPQLVAAVHAAQQAENPTPAQMVAFREDIDRVSGRIRGLQSTVAEHEKNVEALKKELGSLKP
jgi:hypothetical protein